MAADGAVRFITKIDTNGFNKGTNEISSKILALKNKIENTSSEISRLSQELEEMANTPIKSSVTEKLEKDVENAKSKLSQLYAEADRIGNSKQSDLTDLGLGTKYLDQMLEQDKGWQKVQSQIKVAEDELQKYERELASAKSAESQVTGKDTAEYAEKKRKLQELCGNLNVYKAQLTEAQQKEKATSNQTSKATDTFKVLYKSVHQVNQRLSEFVKRGLSRAGDGLKNIISGIRHTNSQMGILGKTLKRIQQMLVGMIFYKVIRGGIQAISESLGTLAKNSPRVNSQLSALITSLTYFKNSLASAFAPILNVATPILTKFMDTLSAAANKVANFIATLTGQTSYEKAVKVQQDYAKSLDNTAKSTKKVTKENEKSLASFDELNVMQDNSNNSDNSTADTSSVSYFQTIPTVFNDFANRIKKAFSKGNYKAIGQLIADKLNSAMKKIKWNKIRSTAKSWAKNIAEFLNGFVAKLDWFLTGTTIGNGIMTAVDFAYTFLKRFKWGKFGSGIANFLNRVLKTINFRKLGKTFGVVINSIISFGSNLIKKFNWAKIGSYIGDFINGWFREIDWKKAGQLVSNGIKGALTSAINILETTNFDAIGNDIADFIKNIDWISIGENIIKALGNALESVWTLVTSTIIHLYDDEFDDEIQGIKDEIDDLYSNVQETINEADSKIADILSHNAEIDTLQKELGELVKAGTLSDQEKDKLNTIVSILSSEVPTFEDTWNNLVRINGENIELINKDYDSTLTKIDEVIDKYQEQYATEALADEYKEIYKKRIKYNQKLQTKQKELTSAQNDYNKKLKEYNLTSSEFEKIVDKFTNAKDPLAELTKKELEAIKGVKSYKDNLDEANRSYEKAYGNIDMLNNKLLDYSDIMTVLRGDYSDYKKVQTALTKGFISQEDVVKNTGLSIDKFNKKIKNIDYKEAEKNAENFVKSLDGSGTQIINDLNDNIDIFNEKLSGNTDTIKGYAEKQAKGYMKSFKGGILASSDTISNAFESLLSGDLSVAAKLSNGKVKSTNSKIKTTFVPDAPLTYKVPKLATGTYVPAHYGEFLAVLGDNKREAEIVAPESKIEQAVINAMGKVDIGGGDINLTVKLDGDTVYKTIVKRNNADKKRRGYSLLA